MSLNILKIENGYLVTVNNKVKDDTPEHPGDWHYETKQYFAKNVGQITKIVKVALPELSIDEELPF